MTAAGTRGYFTPGLDGLATAMTGSELIPCDTEATEGNSLAALTPAQLASGPLVVSVPATAFSIQIGNNTLAYLINPAGTLATGTFLLPLAPKEGQELEIASTQIQTAVTVTAGAGHTIVGAAVTALAAAVAVRFRFLATKWYRVV